MTTTILFFVKLGISLIIGYTCLKYLLVFFGENKAKRKGKIKRSDIISDVLFIAFAGFILYYIQNNFQRTFDTVLTHESAAFPTFQFQNIKTGETKTLNNYSSKIKLLNYWATWCGPCRREMPALQELYHDFRRTDLEIIAISDEEESPVKSFMRDKKFDFITAKLTRTNSLLDSITQRPVSILLDNENRILDMVVGSRGHSFFKDWVQDHLDKMSDSTSE